jgi:hypothetical protein
VTLTIHADHDRGAGVGLEDAVHDLVGVRGVGAEPGEGVEGDLPAEDAGVGLRRRSRIAVEGEVGVSTERSRTSPRCGAG